MKGKEFINYIQKNKLEDYTISAWLPHKVYPFIEAGDANIISERYLHVNDKYKNIDIGYLSDYSYYENDGDTKEEVLKFEEEYKEEWNDYESFEDALAHVDVHHKYAYIKDFSGNIVWSKEDGKVTKYDN